MTNNIVRNYTSDSNPSNSFPSERDIYYHNVHNLSSGSDHNYSHLPERDIIYCLNEKNRCSFCMNKFNIVGKLTDKCQRNNEIAVKGIKMNNVEKNVPSGSNKTKNCNRLKYLLIYISVTTVIILSLCLVAASCLAYFSSLKKSRLVWVTRTLPGAGRSGEEVVRTISADGKENILIYNITVNSSNGYQTIAAILLDTNRGLQIYRASMNSSRCYVWPIIVREGNQSESTISAVNGTYPRISPTGTLVVSSKAIADTSPLGAQSQIFCAHIPVYWARLTGFFSNDFRPNENPILAPINENANSLIRDRRQINSSDKNSIIRDRRQINSFNMNNLIRARRQIKSSDENILNSSANGGNKFVNASNSTSHSDDVDEIPQPSPTTENEKINKNSAASGPIEQIDRTILRTIENETGNNKLGNTGITPNRIITDNASNSSTFVIQTESENYPSTETETETITSISSAAALLPLTTAIGTMESQPQQQIRMYWYCFWNWTNCYFISFPDDIFHVQYYTCQISCGFRPVGT